MRKTCLYRLNRHETALRSIVTGSDRYDVGGACLFDSLSIGVDEAAHRGYSVDNLLAYCTTHKHGSHDSDSALIYDRKAPSGGRNEV